MRWYGVGMACVALASCSKAPDGPAEMGSSVAGGAGVAFNYAYRLRVPSGRISTLQDAHARACERLGSRCRITGLTFNVDDAGRVDASLSVRLAAPLARAFGRNAVAAAEAADGALVGAQISGTEAQSVADDSIATQADAAGERARLDRELARSDLPGAERAELRRQRAAIAEGERAARGVASSAGTALAMTPVSFTYAAGRGTGFRATLTDAGAAALASTAATLAALIWLLSRLGPPLVVLIAIVMIWHRWDRRWRDRLSARPSPGTDIAS